MAEPERFALASLVVDLANYNPNRDHVKCFPFEEKRVIQLETSIGLAIAARALRNLNLSSIDITTLDLARLFRGYVNTKKMLFLGASADQTLVQLLCW